VIIGILAAIAIPKFANTKERRISRRLKSDLRNLVTAEEAVFRRLGEVHDEPGYGVFDDQRRGLAPDHRVVG